MRSTPKPHLSPAVSLEDLAQHVKLAVGTVSRALNGNQRVNEKTRARVLAAAEALGYCPSPLARGLRVGRTGLVGLTFFMNSPSRNLNISAQLYFLQKLLKEQGKRTLVEFSAWEYADKVRAIEHFLAMRAEGVIHVGGFPPELLASFAALRERKIPYVLLNPSGTNLPFSVSLNRTSAYEKITDHLLDLGHTTFTLLGIMDTPPPYHPGSYHCRIEGVRRSLSRRGLVFENCVKICFLMPRPLEAAYELGQRLAKEFYKELRETTACLASNDEVALGAIHYLKSQGCTVPRDLSVVGFDDTAPFSDPPLTTVSQEIEKATQIVVTMFQAAATHGMERDIPAVNIEPTVIFRDSTGPAPSLPVGS